MTSEEINNAYRAAIKFTSAHYENFPALSVFYRYDLNKHIAVIYRFARQADDIADEGNDSPSERMNKLNRYRDDFANALAGKFKNDFWAALINTINEKKLDTENFFNLLAAFEQDIVKSTYADTDELFDYCRRSANPVGRLILELFDMDGGKNYLLSDKICTALQLTNFWQDISVDIKKKRVYLPLNILNKRGIVITENWTLHDNSQLQSAVKECVEMTEKLFADGKKLTDNLSGFLKYQIKLTILGGMAILEKIKKNNYRVVNFRPRLTKLDYLKIIFIGFKRI